MKPIAWYDPSNGMVSTDQDCSLFTPLGQVWALYPEREWAGLTDKDIDGLWEMAQMFKPHKHFYLLIEAKLKEKNERR